MKRQELATMPASWEFYLCVIERYPASMMVDLAWHPHAPVRQYPVLLEVDVSLLIPDEDGLSDPREAQRLFALEDQLAVGMSANLNGWYVGRMTRKGKRIFYFYAPTSTDVQQEVHKILGNFLEYNWMVIHQYDPQWILYRELLVPSEEEAHLIKNRRALDELVRRGDRLKRPRPITHQFQFESEHQVSVFLQQVGLHREQDASVRINEEGIQVSFIRESGIERHFLDGITWEFAQLGRKCGGSYLGWRSEVISA